MTISTTEKPLTKYEEERMETVTDDDWNYAVERHIKAYDRDDLQSDAYEYGDAILKALDSGEAGEVWLILSLARAKTVARRARFELTGKVTK